jgi:excisionase family DNA binding protein
MPDEKKWITVAEAAEKSGYSMRTIQELLKKGKIEGWKPGHDWFTTLEAVLEYKGKAKRGRPKKNKN